MSSTLYVRNAATPSIKSGEIEVRRCRCLHCSPAHCKKVNHKDLNVKRNHSVQIRSISVFVTWNEHIVHAVMRVILP